MAQQDENHETSVAEDISSALEKLERQSPGRGEAALRARALARTHLEEALYWIYGPPARVVACGGCANPVYTNEVHAQKDGLRYHQSCAPNGATHGHV